MGERPTNRSSDIGSRILPSRKVEDKGKVEEQEGQEQEGFRKEDYEEVLINLVRVSCLFPIDGIVLILIPN